MAGEMMMKSMREAISNVMETMFFLPVQIHEKSGTLQEWFSGEGLLSGVTLSFNGPFEGSSYLLIPASEVKEMTANFLGLPESEIDEEQKRDTIKEALNMIAGYMFSLFDKKGAFRLGIPRWMSEDELSHDKLKDLKGDILFIETEDNHMAAGINMET